MSSIHPRILTSTVPHTLLSTCSITPLGICTYLTLSCIITYPSYLSLVKTTTTSVPASHFGCHIHNKRTSPRTSRLLLFFSSLRVSSPQHHPVKLVYHTSNLPLHHSLVQLLFSTHPPPYLLAYLPEHTPSSWPQSRCPQSTSRAHARLPTWALHAHPRRSQGRQTPS